MTVSTQLKALSTPTTTADGYPLHPLLVSCGLLGVGFNDVLSQTKHGVFVLSPSTFTQLMMRQITLPEVCRSFSYRNSIVYF